MNACTWLWSSGSVLLPNPKTKPWVDDFVEEHVLAHVGKYDDQVDCAAQYLNWAGARDRNTLFKKAMGVVAQKLYSY